MAGEKLPPPSSGKVITILSIDGGGVRGIIPAILLMRLEAELQKCKGNKNVRIADYFDVIAGTSTGGLIAAMLAAPDENNRPLFSAAEIKDFYRKKSPKIFPEKCFLQDMIHYLYKPKYSGDYLHETIRKYLKDTKLSQTLAKVVIPTYDMKLFRPTIFSSLKLKANPSLDAKLSDICIGTSAAPTYLPPYYFQNKQDDTETEFNLIDGGVIANNPALIAISEVMQQETMGNPDFSGYEPQDYTKIFLVSLGTGFQEPNKHNDARHAAYWGILNWAKPIIEFALDGSQDLVDYHLASVFQALGDQGHENYLRIQTDELTGHMADMDCASKDNLNDLEGLANRLLGQTVTKMNLDTFKLEPQLGGPTNAEAIKKVAEFLTNEKQERLAKFQSI